MEFPVRNSNSELQVPPPRTDIKVFPFSKKSSIEFRYHITSSVSPRLPRSFKSLNDSFIIAIITGFSSSPSIISEVYLFKMFSAFSFEYPSGSSMFILCTEVINDTKKPYLL